MTSQLMRVALLGALLALPGPLRAQEGPAPAARESRFRLILNGAFDLGSLDFTDSRSFELFVESARLDSHYEVSAGTGFDGGLEFAITPIIGVMASVSVTERDAEADIAASLPHPLFFAQPRSVSGRLSGLSYKERSVHVSLTIGGSAGKLEFIGFGGVTFFKVEAELVQNIEFDQIYPFDTVALTGTSRVGTEDSPVGFHVGGRIDLRFSRHVGVGAQLRFSRATAELSIPEAASVEVDAGGAQAAVGIRLYF